MVYSTVKHFVISAGADFRKIMEENLPFLEELAQVLLYKQEIFGQYQRELLLTILSDNSAIRQFINSVYLREIRQTLSDFYEQGKKEGYINSELSTETLIHYSEIMRKGMVAESSLSKDLECNPKAAIGAEAPLSLRYTRQPG